MFYILGRIKIKNLHMFFSWIWKKKQTISFVNTRVSKLSSSWQTDRVMIKKLNQSIGLKTGEEKQEVTPVVDQRLWSGGQSKRERERERENQMARGFNPSISPIIPLLCHWLHSAARPALQSTLVLSSLPVSKRQSHIDNKESLRSF